MLSADELLSTTRAVRKRLDVTRSVPREVVLDCVRLATQAPTGENRTRVRWLLVDDRDVVGKAGEIYRTTIAETRAQRMVRPGEERMYASVDHLAEIMPRMPMLAVPYTKVPWPTKPPVHVLTFWASVVPTIWSMQLALRSRALGSTLTTAHLIHADDMAEVLGLPDPFTQLGMLPIAYTLGSSFHAGQRPPVETLVQWNRYA